MLLQLRHSGVILLLLPFFTVGLEVGFTQQEYRAKEDALQIKAIIAKEGNNTADLYIQVMTLPYTGNTTDPAEYNASGTGDFESFSQTIVFQASSGYFQASVVVEIADDDVNEAEEAFVILLVPDLNRSNSSDLLDLQLTNGTALGVIEDNDEISFAFEATQYTVQENVGAVKDLVNLVKEGGRLSEQLLTVEVHSSGGTATDGVDYQLPISYNITFYPENQSLPVQFKILDDVKLENDEAFTLFTSGPLDISVSTTTTVIILDDENVTLSFRSKNYTVTEEIGYVDVCIAAEHPTPSNVERSSFYVSSEIETELGTATELDFISLHLTRYVYINPSYTEVRCVRINIRRDTLDESTEFFYVRLRGPISFSSSSPVNIELETFETTVYISNSDDMCEDSSLFVCQNSLCIPFSDECDGRNDCIDSSDEGPSCDNCTGGSQFLCANGNCVNYYDECDGYNDCGDCSDELSCGNTMFMCGDGSCIPSNEECNAVDNCGDCSDEIHCGFPLFHCNNNHCVLNFYKCDGTNHCGDSSDEEKCCLSDEFTCSNDNCVAAEGRCDGSDDCGDASDESGCDPLSSQCSIRGVDIYFVLDRSGSVGNSNFQIMLKFIQEVVSSYEIGPQHTQVGIISYSSSAIYEFFLDTYSDKDSLLEAITNVPSYTGGSTNTAGALNLVKSGFDDARPVSQGIPRVAVIMTDGQSNSFSATVTAAETIHEETNILLFAIGVGTGVNVLELFRMSSKPEFLLLLSGFDVIMNFLSVLATATCEVSSQLKENDTIVSVIDKGQKSFFETAVPSEGITVILEAPDGMCILYGSDVVENPDESDHKFKLEASPTTGPASTFQNNSKTSVIFITIEGVEELNAFAINIIDGDEPNPPDIDECKLGEAVCDHICKNTIGSFFCDCNTGYTADLSGINCIDIDECSRNLDNCDQLCTNALGNFSCGCNIGYELASNFYQCIELEGSTVYFRASSSVILTDPILKNLESIILTYIPKEDDVIVNCYIVSRRPIDLQNNTHRMECKASHFPILQSFSSLVEDVVTLNLLNETDFLLATTVSFSVFGFCDYETKSNYSWMESIGGEMVQLPCEFGAVMEGGKAERLCMEGGHWQDPDLELCVTYVTYLFQQFSDENITAENVNSVLINLAEVVAMANDLVDQTPTNFGVVVELFNTSVEVAEVTEQGVTAGINMVDDIQDWPEDVVQQMSSFVVQSLETLLTNVVEGENFTNLTFTGEDSAFVAERVNTSNALMNGSSFTLSRDNGTLFVKTGTGTVFASIFLPGSLFVQVSHLLAEEVGMFSSLYETAVLFPLSGVNRSEIFIASPVIGASVVVRGDEANLVPIMDLSEPVIIHLQLINIPENATFTGPLCVSWDFEALGGRGNWTDRGCNTTISDNGNITCTCHHLTNFAVLVDISSRTNMALVSETLEDVLSYVSWIGLIISLIGLTLTVIALLAFKKSRTKDITPIHVHLCIALICLLFVFLVGIERTENTAGCITVSVLIQYFTLVAVMWMGSEAVFLFQLIIIVVVHFHRRYYIINALICWLIPLVPVVIPLAINRDLLITSANLNQTRQFCFISDYRVLFGAYLGPVFAVLLFNVVMFIVTITILVKQIKKGQKSKSKTHNTVQLLTGIIGLMSLFGLTWLFGALTISKASSAFQILFTFFNSFQGLFIFAFLCVFNRDVRSEFMQLFNNFNSTCFKIGKQPPQPSSTSSTTGTMQTFTRSSNTAKTAPDVVNGTVSVSQFEELDEIEITFTAESDEEDESDVFRNPVYNPEEPTS